MTLQALFIGWFYYGIQFMGLSVLATFMLNKVVTRYYTAPLIINAVSIALLLLLLWQKQLTAHDFWVGLLFRYMPVVFASVCFNSMLYLVRRGRPLREI